MVGWSALKRDACPVACTVRPDRIDAVKNKDHHSFKLFATDVNLGVR